MSSKRKKNKKKNKNIKNVFQNDAIKTSFRLDNSVCASTIDVDSDINLHRVKDGEFEVVSENESELIAFDENLLDKALIQWQFGDWESLARLQRETLQHHPDRAKLALLSAAGNMQCGSLDQARKIARLAQEWGCGKQLVSRIMIAGVYNSLGRVATICNHQLRALKYFEYALSIGAPGSDLKLLTKARASEQIKQLELSTVGGYLETGIEELTLGTIHHSVPSDSVEALPLNGIHQKWQTGCWGSLTKIDNAELVSQRNRADLALYAACGYQQLDDVDGLQRCTRLAQEWGCSCDKIKKFLAAGIQNILAVCQAVAGQYESAAKNFVASLCVDQKKPENLIVKNRVVSQISNLSHIDEDQVIEAIANHLE